MLASFEVFVAPKVKYLAPQVVLVCEPSPVLQWRVLRGRGTALVAASAYAYYLSQYYGCHKQSHKHQKYLRFRETSRYVEYMIDVSNSRKEDIYQILLRRR